MKTNKINIVFLFSYLLAIVFSIKSFREPDTWWQLRTGEWILENFSVPKVDIFSFTMNGQPWLNIKWGYEVIIAILAKYLGVESLPVLQIIVSCGILYFLFKILKSLNIGFGKSWFWGAALLFIGIQYRMITRPEMFSHLFVVIYIYILLDYFQNKTNKIFLLPLLQILWCNLHEAFAIGIVLLIIAVVAMFINYIVYKNKLETKLVLAFVFSVCSIAVNPRGLLLFKSPLDIFGQVAKNKYTTELGNVFSKDYWQIETMLLALIICFAMLFFKQIIVVLKKYSNNKLNVFCGIVLAAFVYLAGTAYRNVVFLYLILFPVFVILIQALYNFIVFKQPALKTYSKIITIVGFGVLYISIVSNKYYSVTNSRDIFGLQVLSINNPVGATNYIQQKELYKQKGFTDYLTSSYAMYNLPSEYKTYIDLRDLDVFPKSLFDRYTLITNEPAAFFKEDKKYNFKYVMLFRNNNEKLHYYLYNDSIYACVFVDPVCAVYEKTDNFSSGDIFQACNEIENSRFANAINKIFNPAFSYLDYTVLPYDLEACSYYLNVGKLSLAEKRLNSFLQYNQPNETSTILSAKIADIKAKYLGK